MAPGATPCTLSTIPRSISTRSCLCMHCSGSLLASLGLDSWREARLGDGGSGAGTASGADLEAGLGKKDGGGLPGRPASRCAACALFPAVLSYA